MSDAPNMIDVTIDDVQVSVPQGTLVIRAAEQAGFNMDIGHAVRARQAYKKKKGKGGKKKKKR